MASSFAMVGALRERTKETCLSFVDRCNRAGEARVVKSSLLMALSCTSLATALCAADASHSLAMCVYLGRGGCGMSRCAHYPDLTACLHTHTHANTFRICPSLSPSLFFFCFSNFLRRNKHPQVCKLELKKKGTYTHNTLILLS